jgi:hypothetical protein
MLIVLDCSYELHIHQHFMILPTLMPKRPCDINDKKAVLF